MDKMERLLKAKEEVLKRPNIRTADDVRSYLITHHPHLSYKERQEVAEYALASRKDEKRPAPANDLSQNAQLLEELRTILRYLLVWWPNLRPRIAYEVLKPGLPLSVFESIINGLKMKIDYNQLSLDDLSAAQLREALPYIQGIAKIAGDRCVIDVPEVPILPKGPPLIEPMEGSSAFATLVVKSAKSSIDRRHANNHPLRRGRMTVADQQRIHKDAQDLLRRQPGTTASSAYEKIPAPCSFLTFKKLFDKAREELNEVTDQTSQL